jgi:hypothetical protein
LPTRLPTLVGQTYIPTSPSTSPTSRPTVAPTGSPTEAPSPSPSALPTKTGDTHRPTAVTASPSLAPSAAPYDPYSTPGTRCNETGFLAPLIDPTPSQCQSYCTEVGVSVPFYFNYYQAFNTSLCFCIPGSNCTVVPDPYYIPYYVSSTTKKPTVAPTVAPTVIPPYQPLPVTPPGEKCQENGTLAPLINPSIDNCYTYCSLYGGFTSVPSYFNYYNFSGTFACFCVGSNCTAVPAYNYQIIRVNNKTIATFGPTLAPSIR